MNAIQNASIEKIVQNIGPDLTIALKDVMDNPRNCFHEFTVAERTHVSGAMVSYQLIVCDEATAKIVRAAVQGYIDAIGYVASVNEKLRSHHG